MSGYKTFAIIGGLGDNTPASAGIGRKIAIEFLKHGYNVRVLAREASGGKSSAQELTDLGAQVVVVDYNDASTVEAALKGVDVVISGLGGAGRAVSFQGAVAEAAKRAGVKLFVPSEYGVDTIKSHPGLASYVKRQLHDKLRDIELPYALFFTGGFNSFLYFFIKVQDGKASIIGNENTRISFTAEKNIAEYMFLALTKLSPYRLSNSVFNIAGTTATFAEHIANISAHKGQPIEIETISIAEGHKKYKETGNGYYGIATMAALGLCDTESVDRELFPEIEWIPVSASF